MNNIEPRAAGVLFLYQDKILFLQKTDTGVWSFPYGKIEPGEEPLQTAIRETLEETGQSVANLELFCEFDGCFTYLCQIDAPFEPVLSDEHQAYIWTTIDALPEPLVSELNELAGVAAVMDSAQQIDGNGFITIEANPICKAGVYPYWGSKLPGAPDPNRWYQVYRPEAELNTPECIDSFKLLPWIDDHAMLGEGATPIEEKNVPAVVGESVFYQDGTIYAKLKIFSKKLWELIKSGKNQLSAGYRAKFDWTPGIYNGVEYECIIRQPRGNHLALVKEGRTGPELAVLDSIDDEGNMTKQDVEKLKALVAAGKPVMDESDDNTQTVGEKEAADEGADAGEGNKAADKAAAMTLEEANALLEQLMPLLQKLMESGVVKAAPADKPVDVDDSPVMDAKDMQKKIMADIALRDKLAKRLSEHVGVFDHADMTAEDVANYGIKKLEIKAQKGQEMAVLAGYLQAAKVSPQAQVMDEVDTESLDKLFNSGRE